MALRGKFAHAYTPQKTRDFEDEIRILARKQWKKPPLEGPIKAEIVFFIENPKKTKKTLEFEPHIKRGDLDNYCKAIFDAINEIVFLDDSQIWKLNATKMMVKDPKEVGITLSIY